MPVLKQQSYGKDLVRVVKVLSQPNNPVQDVADLTVRVLLEGEFTTSYTKADNSSVVATDSIKNIVYHLARRSRHVGVPELFALEIGQFFLNTYSHVSHVHVRVIRHPWDRMTLPEFPQGHPHSFVKSGDELRRCDAVVSRQGAELSSGIRGLIVLKTTGSSFTGFVRDQFTTLPEAQDRILSTAVRADWRYHSTDVKQLMQMDFDKMFNTVRHVTLYRFATEQSASVQATLYNMACEVLDKCRHVSEIGYRLPNRHVFQVPDVLGEKSADVYKPLADPAGLITATVSRTSAKL